MNQAFAREEATQICHSTPLMFLARNQAEATKSRVGGDAPATTQYTFQIHKFNNQKTSHNKPRKIIPNLESTQTLFPKHTPPP